MTDSTAPAQGSCDDCPACREGGPENWSECCAACHCCPTEKLCDTCRPTNPED